jgi:hypothetical protein
LTGEECVECKTTVHHWYVAAVVIGVVAAFGLVLYLWWRYQQDTSEDEGRGELVMHLTNNPLQLHGQKQSPRGSLSSRVAERRSNALLAVRVLYQPVRILVGYIQVRATTLLRALHALSPFS